jgi:hypothetical protein
MKFADCSPSLQLRVDILETKTILIEVWIIVNIGNCGSVITIIDKIREFK